MTSIFARVSYWTLVQFNGEPVKVDLYCITFAHIFRQLFKHAFKLSSDRTVVANNEL